MSELATLSDDPASAALAGRWRLALGVLAVALLALLGLYGETGLSMADIWWRSGTYTHGFLVFPLCVWLAWGRRRELARIAPRPDYLALPVFALAGLGWLMARVAGVLVVEQLALTGMVAVLPWLLLGRQVAYRLLFPLGFLIFAVPMGDSLMPRLMDFTADFTVAMLRLTGIPVFREGTFFSIPSGDWSVIEACSGLRYLIASMTLGCLYAYISYRSLWRRLAFMALATLVPIIANGLRAYMIVMIGHLSNMKLAVGVDHLIYGWVFFGLVMLLLFWVGSLWSDTGVAASADVPPPAAVLESPALPAYAAGLVLSLAVAALWPARAGYIERQVAARIAPVSLELPEAAGPWRAAATPLTAWEPFYVGPDAKFTRTYRDGAATVQLFLLYYRQQKQGAELVNSENVLLPSRHPVWKMPGEQAARVSLDGRPASVLQGRLLSDRQRLLTWRWNRIDGEYTANGYIGKWLEARDKLLGRFGDSVGIVVATAYDGQPDPQVLQRFVDALLPALETRLSLAAGD